MIRRVVDDDLPVVIKLWKENILTSNTADDIRRAYLYNKKYFFLWDDGGKILGFVAGTLKSRKRGHISGIAVDENYRRRGIGRALMEAAEREFLADGCEMVTLEVRPSNLGAIQFYEKMGYERTHVVPFYYFDGEDAVNYRKWIR
jgi:ribosomal-protein-alanine N-acetyltransferase